MEFLGDCFGPRRSCSWSVVDCAEVDDVVVDDDVVVVAAAVLDVFDSFFDDVPFLLPFLGDDVSAAFCRSPSSQASRFFCCRLFASQVEVRQILRRFRLIRRPVFCGGLRFLLQDSC